MPINDPDPAKMFSLPTPAQNFVFVQGHIYLSTACYHGYHDYCKRERGLMGEKIPAKCKFCDAKCWCSCHNEEPAHEHHEPARENGQMEVL